MEPSIRVTDIRKDGERHFKQKMGRWLYIVIAIGLVIDALVLSAAWYLIAVDGFDGDSIEGLVMLALAPWLFLAILKGIMLGNIRQNFWKQYASDNGYAYTVHERTEGEKGLMFREGHSNRAHNILSGDHGGLPVRFFEYTFTIGSGKSSQTYHYTAFEFRFSGTFPHAYLNYTKDGYNIRPAGELHLPGSLAEKFKLYAPEQYEIEVLQIFTPDVLALIEDLGWKCDLELVDQELIIYRPGLVHTRGELDMEFGKAAALAAKLRPTLERMTLAEIGGNKPILRSYTTLKEFNS